MSILKYIGSCTVLLLMPAVQAQNARLVLSGAAVRLNSSGASVQIVLQNANWENNASTTSFVPGTGTVLFSGSTTAQLGGTQSSAFYNLSSSKSGAELQLNQDISVSNTATLAAGNINLQNARLDLLGTGMLSGEVYPGGSRVYCADNQLGNIRSVRVLGSGANNDIAGLGISINVSGTAPGSTTIIRGHQRQNSTAFAGAGTSIGRYYDISPAVSSGYTYLLSCRYHDQELYGMPESDFLFYRSPSYGLNSADWEAWGGSTPGPLSPGYPAVGTVTHNAASNTVSLPGISTFSRWTLSNALSEPLPIELGDFSAACTAGGVNLQWLTLSEVNNNYFTIERSMDSQSWETLAEVPGAGNSNTMLQYSVNDERPFNGISYYRLRQTDYNGDFEVFAPLSIVCETIAGDKAFELFPNPASDVFNIRFSARAAENGRIAIYDMAGRCVYEERTAFTDGLNTYTRSGLGVYMPGVYTVRVSSGTDVLYTAALVIQR